MPEASRLPRVSGRRLTSTTTWTHWIHETSTNSSKHSYLTIIYVLSFIPEIMTVGATCQSFRFTCVDALDGVFHPHIPNVHQLLEWHDTSLIQMVRGSCNVLCDCCCSWRADSVGESESQNLSIFADSVFSVNQSSLRALLQQVYCYVQATILSTAITSRQVYGT